MVPPILLFDGDCTLCNKGIQCIIKHDLQKKLRFATLQSQIGKSLLAQRQLPTENHDSLILLEKNRVFSRSTAVLKTARYFSDWWKYFYWLIGIPSPIRDWIYYQIAKNRYRWFIQNRQCMLPTAELQKRFLHYENIKQ